MLYNQEWVEREIQLSLPSISYILAEPYQSLKDTELTPLRQNQCTDKLEQINAW